MSFQFSVLGFFKQILKSGIAGSFFSLVIAIVLKSVLPDVSIATSVLFCFVSIFKKYHFRPFVFSMYVSFNLK